MREPLEIEHGAEALVWDAIQRGWVIICLCGWACPPYPLCEDAGAEFDEHLVVLATSR